MLNDYVKIESSVLPTLYPVIGFTDKKYVTNRVVKIDFYSEIFETADKFRLVNDQFERVRTIQTLLYNKYSLLFFAKESSGIQTLKFGDQLSITLKSGEVHRAIVLQLDDGDRLNNTEQRLYELIYYDANPNNYQDNQQPVNSFLKPDVLLDRYDTAQLNKVTILSTKTIDAEFTNRGNQVIVYTSLIPELTNSDVVQEIGEVDGLKKVSRSNTKKLVVLTLFLGQTQKNLIQKYTPLCDTITSKFTLDGITYDNISILENITPEITRVEGAVDVYKIVYRLPYENLTFNHYA